MIPKVIHYCWFGRNPLPELAQKCIASWRKYFPDYEIREWNEDNFDVNMIPYTKEAYLAKKYAFVSDYARFWILYKYGGLYFDTDVEVIKPMDDIIDRGPFMGLEKMEKDTIESIAIAPGLGIGCYKGHYLYKEILDFYKNTHYITWSGKMSGTVVNFTTSIIMSKIEVLDVNKITNCCGIYIYPNDYFDPINYYTGVVTITNNTRTIHKYAASWVKKENKLKRILNRLKRIIIRINVNLNSFI